MSNLVSASNGMMVLALLLVVYYWQKIMEAILFSEYTPLVM